MSYCVTGGDHGSAVFGVQERPVIKSQLRVYFKEAMSPRLSGHTAET